MTTKGKEDPDIRPLGFVHQSKTSPHKQNDSDTPSTVTLGEFLSRCLLGKGTLSSNDTKKSRYESD